MGKQLLVVFFLSLASQSFGQPQRPEPRTPDDQAASREAGQTLRDLNEAITALAQSAQSMDLEKQRQAARQLRQIDKDLKRYADPSGLQAAISEVMLTLRAVSMQTSRLQGPALARLSRDLRAVDADLARSLGPEAVAKARGARKEGAAKGSLGAIRSALSIYYGDKEGVYPASLDALPPKYLGSIPTLQLPDHQPSSAWRAIGGVGSMADIQGKLEDSGQWLYVSEPSSPMFGTVLIDCTHNDSRGRPWYGF